MEETKNEKNNYVRNSVIAVIFVVLLAIVTIPIWNNGGQGSDSGKNEVGTVDAAKTGETTAQGSPEGAGSSEISDATNAKVFPVAALAAKGDNKIFDSSTGEVITIPQSDPETENQEMIMDSRSGAVTPVPESDPGN